MPIEPAMTAWNEMLWPRSEKAVLFLRLGAAVGLLEPIDR